MHYVNYTNYISSIHSFLIYITESENWYITRPYFCFHIYKYNKYGIYAQANMSCFSADGGNFCPIWAIVFAFKILYYWLYWRVLFHFLDGFIEGIHVSVRNCSKQMLLLFQQLYMWQSFSVICPDRDYFWPLRPLRP